MRRRAGVLLPIEISILRAAVDFALSANREFHGFEIAKRLRDGDDSRGLTAHGTLYKALSRMEKAGLLESRWEDPRIAADERRPRRRLYRITVAGRAAVATLNQRAHRRLGDDPGLATT